MQKMWPKAVIYVVQLNAGELQLLKAKPAYLLVSHMGAGQFNVPASLPLLKSRARGLGMLLVRRADSRRCVQAACEWKIMSPGKVVFAPIKRRLPCSRRTPMTPIRRCRLIKTLGAASDTR